MTEYYSSVQLGARNPICSRCSEHA